MERGYTEKDWRLFRAKIADWQEAYMERLNQEYVELLTSPGNASDKFWKLEKRIKRDKKDAGVCVEMSRSTMVFNIAELLREGAINMNDLADFSEELQEWVRMICRRWHEQ